MFWEELRHMSCSPPGITWQCLYCWVSSSSHTMQSKYHRCLVSSHKANKIHLYSWGCLDSEIWNSENSGAQIKLNFEIGNLILGLWIAIFADVNFVPVYPLGLEFSVLKEHIAKLLSCGDSLEVAPVSKVKLKLLKICHKILSWNRHQF